MDTGRFAIEQHLLTGKPIAERPRQDSNLRHRLRRPVLYPLSYGGGRCPHPCACRGTIVAL